MVVGNGLRNKQLVVNTRNKVSVTAVLRVHEEVIKARHTGSRSFVSIEDESKTRAAYHGRSSQCGLMLAAAVHE